MYNENYKILLKETEEDINKWEHISCYGLKDLILLRMSILSKTIYRFKASPIKMPVALFKQKIEKPKLKVTWNLKGFQQPEVSGKKEQNFMTHTLLSKLTTEIE